MADHRGPALGLDSFWLEADANDCADNPLERELCYRLESAERFGRMIAEAQENGHDDIVDSLIEQQNRMTQLAHELQQALRRYQPRA